MNNWEPLKLREVVFEVKSPDICAICGAPAADLFQVQPGEKTKSGNGSTVVTGGVWAKLCEKHQPPPLTRQRSHASRRLARIN